MANVRTLTQVEKENKIVQALQSPEGRYQIGQTMIEPFKTGRDYRSIIRKVMAVDVLPTAAPMWYDKDPQFAAVVMGENGSVPYTVFEGTRVELEPMAIAIWVKIPALETAVRRFPALDRAQEKGRIEMAREEDNRGFTAITIAATTATGHNTVINTANGYACTAGLTKAVLSDLFLGVEQHNAPVFNLLMHPAQYRDLRNWDRDAVDPVTQYDLLRTGYVGDIWNARIRTTVQMVPGSALVVAEPQYFGVISERVSLNVWEA